MKLERFQMFSDFVGKDASLKALAPELVIYRYFEGKWFDGDGDELSPDDTLIGNLDRTRDRGGHWRRTNNRNSYFPIIILDAIAVVTFDSPSKSQTRNRVQSGLDRCLSEAINAFDATHDKLTGLLNREKFQELVTEETKSAVRSDFGSSTTDELRSINIPLRISIISIDIDFFKQVNDTHGHLYGDAVLKCLAHRLERLAVEIENDSDKQISILCARPSGEEFLLFVKGAKNPNDEIEIANDFRKEISERELPSDAEWGEIVPPEIRETIDPPHVSERTLTVSVGVTSSEPDGDEVDASRIAQDLLNQADVALYV